MRTEFSINEMINRAVDQEGELPGMSYEQGVQAALEWVMECVDEDPIEKKEIK